MTDPEEFFRLREAIAPGYLAAMQEGWSYIESVYRLHEALRPEYEELIWESGPSLEALVAGQLTRQAVTTMRTIAALDRAYEAPAAFAMMRTAEENAGNLFYILYAGPIEESRSREDLAEQFLSYRDIEHARFVNKSRGEYRNRFKNGFVPPDGPQTLADFETLCDSVIAQADATKARFPAMGSGSWHHLNKEDRTRRVLKHLPPIAEHARAIWESTAGVTSIYNMQMHSSPFLFQKDASNLERGKVLELEAREPGEPNWCVSAGQMAVACWYALGDVFGQADKVREKFKSFQFAALEDLFQNMRKC